MAPSHYLLADEFAVFWLLARVWAARSSAAAPRRARALAQLPAALFVPPCPKRHSFLGYECYNGACKRHGTRGRETSMRVFIACAIILTAAIGLGGCFGHHEAVVTQPLKLG